MSRLLEGIDAGDLLKRLPPNVRTSLEKMERSGTDWNAVGNLLAGTPTAGVACAGTGQWPADLWHAVKWEFRSFLCTDSEPYAELRNEWDKVRQRSSALAVGLLAKHIARKLGVASGVIAPLVTWLLVVARRLGEGDMCLTLSTAPGVGSTIREHAARRW